MASMDSAGWIRDYVFRGGVRGQVGASRLQRFVCVHMYVCVHACMHVYIQVNVVEAHRHICQYLSTCLSMYTHTNICIDLE